MKNKSKWYYRAMCFLWERINTIVHILLLGILTRYIFMNWAICVSMQFFSQFDGNNILFLVWIADILLFLYDIEIKEGKLLKHKIEKAAKQINDESVALTLEQRAEKIDSMLSEMSAKMNGGEEK